VRHSPTLLLWVAVRVLSVWMVPMLITGVLVRHGSVVVILVAMLLVGCMVRVPHMSKRGAVWVVHRLMRVALLVPARSRQRRDVSRSWILLLGITILSQLLLLVFFNRFTDGPTHRTPRVLTSMIMTQNITATHTVCPFAFLLFARRNVLP